MPRTPPSRDSPRRLSRTAWFVFWLLDNSHLAQLVELGRSVSRPGFNSLMCVFRLACCCLARAVPAAGARPPRRAALALLPLVLRTRTRPSLALAGRFPAVLSFCLLRIAPRAAPARTQFSCASTDDRRTDDATCGPQEWLTGKLPDGGIRSVRSPLRRAPLLATPIATPLQCGRPERSDLLFL